MGLFSRVLLYLFWIGSLFSIYSSNDISLSIVSSLWDTSYSWSLKSEKPEDGTIVFLLKKFKGKIIY